MTDVKSCLLIVLSALQCSAVRKEVPTPGFGYPGALSAYRSSAKLKTDMSRFGMSAGWFRRSDLPVYASSNAAGQRVALFALCAQAQHHACAYGHLFWRNRRTGDRFVSSFPSNDVIFASDRARVPEEAPMLYLRANVSDWRGYSRSAAR